MKWKNITRGDLNGAVAAVKYGHDPVAARNLIEYFHERMSSGVQYDLDILHELMVYVFAGILDGKTADQAFGLKLRKGEYPRKDTLSRDLSSTACMVLLMRKGVLWIDAKGEAANLLFPDGKGDKAVERAYALYHKTLDRFLDETLHQLLTPHELPS